MMQILEMKTQRTFGGIIFRNCQYVAAASLGNIKRLHYMVSASGCIIKHVVMSAVHHCVSKEEEKGRNLKSTLPESQ